MLENSAYKQWVFRYTFLELEKDLGLFGDVTTNTIFKAKKNVVGKVLAKENGVLAGMAEIRYFLVESSSDFRSKLKGRFELKSGFKDGDSIKKGDVILEIKAELHDLLATERVVLNLLGRMSGIATFTKKIVDIVKGTDVLITPTRKTLWGLLDKKAVVSGGGGTHRLSLSDAILVKDNHLDLMDRDFKLLFERISFEKPEVRFIEIEVDNFSEAIKCAEIFSGSSLKSVLAIMMDNMEVSEVEKTVKELKKRKLYDEFLLEASGGINEKNVLSYARTGVDIVSMGCLTSAAKMMDLSMEVVK